jgi:3-deoxy-8-phosphooctulonate synthase
VSIRFEDFQNPGKLVLIAGPCVIESEDHVHFMADAISTIAEEQGFRYVFKASYDKANRTSLKGYRGPGLTEGLRILNGLKSRGYSLLTDIHETSQVAPAAEVVDILQIPAFLCRQTDLLLEAGRTDRIVRVQQSGGGYARPEGYGGRGMASGLRRHSQRAVAERRRRGFGRTAAVHRTAGIGCGRSGCERDFRGSA